MPYIDRDAQMKFIFLAEEEHGIREEALTKIINQIKTPGELNYIITKVIWGYFQNTLGRYSDINEIMGVFTCASMEFYRRVAAPYEDGKMIQNGDVYR